MKPLRVGYLSPQATLGGAERAVELLVEHHDRSRFESSVLFLRDGPLVATFNRMLPTRILAPVRLRHLWKWPSLEAGVVRWLKEERIDILHNTMAYGQIVGGPAALIAGRPSVWFQHGPIGKINDKLASLIPSKNILVNSEFTRAQQALFNPLNIPITTVFSGVRSPDQFRTVFKLRENLRARFGFTAGNFVVGHLARLQKWKGQIQFIEAFAQARRQNNSLRALVVGSSDLGSKQDETEIRARIHTLGLEPFCIMAGFVSDLDEAYAVMDLFVHSSIQPEPLGLTYIEAMSRGIPVIASPQGGPSEVIRNGVNGRLVDPLDVRLLSSTILEIARDLPLRNQLSVEGLRCATRFSATEFTKRVERIYEDIWKSTI